MADDQEDNKKGALKRPASASNGETLFKVKDPQGYEISLYVTAWEKHITVKHPEMVSLLDDLKKTIQHPELIQGSSEYRRTHYYYRLIGRSFLRQRGIYVSAVVERDEEHMTSFIKPAHMVKNLRTGGQTVWLKRM